MVSKNNGFETFIFASVVLQGRSICKRLNLAARILSSISEDISIIVAVATPIM